MNLAISSSILLLFSALLGVIMLFIPKTIETTNNPSNIPQSSSFFYTANCLYDDCFYIDFIIKNNLI